MLKAKTSNLQPATCNRLRSPRFAGSPSGLRRAVPVLCCALLAAISPLQAQDIGSNLSSNGVSQADDTMTADGVQSANGQDDAGTNDVADTNQVFEPGPDGRTRRLQWQAQLRSRLKPQTSAQPGLSDSATNVGPSSLDYSSFRIIAERNIFDPNRVPHSGVRSVQPKTVDAFTFVGTMSYEKGIFAFFDGTRTDYKKALKPDETIAGYKVVSISPDAVKLQLNTNTVALSVGSQMRRRDDGRWDRSASAETYNSTSGSTTTAASSSSNDTAAPTGAESDVLKKMMERRLKE